MLQSCVVSWQNVVSIHAPAGGATGAYRPANNLKRFNPRARRGRDGFLPDLIAVHRVSIHAPAGGATTETLLARAYD